MKTMEALGVPCIVHARLSGPSIECGIPSFDESSRVLAALFPRLPITTSKVLKGRTLRARRIYHPGPSLISRLS